MAAVANIVLADAQGTPVNHTFIPLGTDTNGVWWFEDQSASSPIGYNRISLFLSRPTNPASGSNARDRISRIKWAIHLPTLTTLGTNDAGLTPPPTVAYVERANGEFIIPEEANLLERKNVRKYVQFLMADTQVVAMVETLQNIF